MAHGTDDERELEITAELVSGLIVRQFPRWSGRAITPVERSGGDNRIFRLGDDMLVRLPSRPRYVAQVEKEQRWLPVLAPRLPLPIPSPVAMGNPGNGYPWPWSIYRWLEGGWALWKALILARRESGSPNAVSDAPRVLDEVLADRRG